VSINEGFFDPHTPKPHVCQTPPVWQRRADGWRCPCGHAWVIETLPDRDVNPGEDHVQWRRAPQLDE
jgi:hypothetical protein